MRAPALAVLLVAALGAACADDELPKLEAEQARLAVLPAKSEFWAAVQRKGELLKEKRALEAELAKLRGELEALAAQGPPLEAALAEAERTRSEIQAALGQAQAETRRLQDELEAGRDALVGFRARRAGERS